jgi:DNA-binding NtrC family response regulator
MAEPEILIVDDEPDMLELLRRSLEPDLKCRLSTASSAEQALQVLSENAVDLALVDIKMPGMDGLELLELVKRKWPDLTVVMMTAYGTIETAVSAMKQGAYDFITKPFDHEALLVRLEKALERSSLLAENRRLRQGSSDAPALFHGMAGESQAIRRVFETIRMVAATDFTVLITGESGTGKDLAARAVHELSHRRHQPYIPVNCPTVPEQILESELFGYRKGAFTHATQNKAGLFQQAAGGSIFLDEIGDISPSIQTKLLRVLQEKEIKPLGDARSIRVDVRIIASTNQDLKEKMRKGGFREDFYYRLNVLPVEIPPLRERVGDIPLIADHLFRKHRNRLNKPEKTPSPELMAFFQECTWEGNVREMENLIVQSILFSPSDTVRPDDLQDGGAQRGGHCSGLGGEIRGLPYKAAKERILQDFNRDYIGYLLTETSGNVSRAARMCGMERQALQQIMRRYSISARDFRKP